MSNIILAPSLLAANFAHFGGALHTIHQHDAPWVHFDVMDGEFVSAITFGAQVVQSLRSMSQTFFDVHLMVVRPERQFASFAKAGSNGITFHIEATHHAHALVQDLHKLGIKAGIALNPATPLVAISELLPLLDTVLIMSVNPGAGGQSLIPATLAKAKELADLKTKHHYPYLIEMDGGINNDTIAAVKSAGVEVAVAGSAFFSNPQLDAFLTQLRS
jgi:ribulose-phosphate 3-epimerase